MLVTSFRNINKQFMPLLSLEETQYLLTTDSVALHGATGCIGEKRTI
jgi:hypothetical protein